MIDYVHKANIYSDRVIGVPDTHVEMINHDVNGFIDTDIEINNRFQSIVIKVDVYC